MPPRPEAQVTATIRPVSSPTGLVPPMSRVGTGDRPPVPPARAARGHVELGRLLSVVTAVAAALLAAGIVVHDLARPIGLYGATEYDDGTYFGAAIRLVDGHLPYRDFVFIQPPGITLVMAPIALAAHGIGARGALALARVLTAVVAGVNVLLVAHLVRHRSLAAVVTGAFVLAAFPAAIYADHTMMLEPYLVLFCLIGANLALSGDELTSVRWRLVAGGVAFGFAGTVKTWAVVPLLALCVCAVWRSRRSGALLVAGAAAGFVLPCLPFVLLAPHAFFHDVVASQLARAAARHTGVALRLVSIVGVRGVAGVYQSRILAVRVAVVLAAFLVAASLAPALRRRGSPLEWFALLATAGTVTAILVPPEFYSHYAYFSAPFLALALALAADRVVRLATRLAAPARGTARRRLATAAAVLAALAVVAGLVPLVTAELKFDSYSLTKRSTDPGPAIEAVVPAGACAVSDAASLLISADRFTSARPGCPELVDATGTWLSLDPHHPPSLKGPFDPALVALWKRWFEQAQYVVQAGPRDFRIPWTPALRQWFLANYRLVYAGKATVWRHLAAPKAGVALGKGRAAPVAARRASAA